MDIHHWLSMKKNRLPESELIGFYRDYIMTNLRSIRMAIALCILLFTLFTVMDYLVFKQEIAKLWLIRFGIIIPVAILNLGLTYTKSFLRYGQFFLAVLTLITGLGICGMIRVAPLDVRNVYYVGLILVFMFSFTFLRLRFVFGTVSGIIIFLAYETLILSESSDYTVIIGNTFFMFGALFIGSLSSFFHEQLSRKEYKTRLNLELEKKNTQNMNSFLETKVKKRTQDLEKLNLELHKAKKRAEESDHLKSRFLANLSHEIRTPMNGILGFTEVLIEQNDEKKCPENQKYLQIIHDNSSQLLNIIDDLIDFSKIEAGIIEIRPEYVNPRTLIEHLLRIMIFTPKVPVLLDFSKDQDPVFTDYTKLSQILSNLLSNAAKFTTEGSITIGYYYLPAQQICFYVKDTGIGIGQEEQDQIFGRFVQGQRPDKQINTGIGLGLAIIKAYAQALQGRITLDSELGKGATFSVILPLRYLSG